MKIKRSQVSEMLVGKLTDNQKKAIDKVLDGKKFNFSWIPDVVAFSLKEDFERLSKNGEKKRKEHISYAYDEATSKKLLDGFKSNLTHEQFTKIVIKGFENFVTSVADFLDNFYASTSVAGRPMKYRKRMKEYFDLRHKFVRESSYINLERYLEDTGIKKLFEKKFKVKFKR